MKKKILYYTRPCYLDAALEYINTLKHLYDVYVVIQMSTSELKSNIIDIETDLSKYNLLTTFSDVKDQWKLDFLQQYFVNCVSVNFLIFKGGILNAVRTSNVFTKYIQNNKFDILHFDDFTGKQLFIFPLLIKMKTKLVLNIHDPKPHSGEFSVSRVILQKYLYHLPTRIIVFSEYSRRVLESLRLGTKVKTFVIRLLPYTVFRKFAKEDNELSKDYISFIGRLSPYKGVDIFVDSIQKVIESYPDQKFLIAGKPLFGYELDRIKVNELKGNLDIKDRYISNEEIAFYLTTSSLVVCPYLDATQSGVIMTAFAFGCPVIVSDVGGLPEYILNEQMGKVIPAGNSEALSNSINLFLRNRDHSTFSSKNFADNFIQEKEKNLEIIKGIYIDM